MLPSLMVGFTLFLMLQGAVYHVLRPILHALIHARRAKSDEQRHQPNGHEDDSAGIGREWVAPFERSWYRGSMGRRKVIQG